MMGLMMLIFMIPLCWLVPVFWFHQYIYMMVFIMCGMKFSFNYVFVNISYFMGLDLLSFMMILLSIWICLLMIMASEKVYSTGYFNCFFLLSVLCLLLFLFLTFSSMNLFIFYIFFEASLMPIFILILGWGYQPERLQAGVYLLFYTLLVSLPMMISIFYCYYELGSLDYFYLTKSLNSFLIYICMNMVFFVKMPMYFIHLWLPKAHVEAPVAGSMILAGVMLKLGGYGLLRLMNLFLMIGMKINFIFVVISLVGGVFVSLVCLRQVDMKSLIAYSSVSHMGLVLGGIMTMSYWGLCGALVMMIAHGLCSSGLFCLANVSYERIKSRSLFLNKGLMNIMPSMTLWWFLFSCCNMASPPSLNLLGEIMLINSLISWSYISMVMLMFISFFSATYSLYLYSCTQHGKLGSMFYSFFSGDIREFLLLMLHWLPLNILVLKSEYLTLWI